MPSRLCLLWSFLNPENTHLEANGFQSSSRSSEDMADHSGNLAHVEDGRSLLPEIVRKEVELEQKLTETQAEASTLIKQAQGRREEAVKKAKADLPEREEKFLQSELKKFDQEFEELRTSENKRLEALRNEAKARVSEASKAIAALTLETQN
jgi:vacuolar-type H+-ATPase subunit H